MRFLLFAGLSGAWAAQQRGTGAKEAKSKWHDASFFDSFQTGESTYSYDGAQVLRAEDNPYHEYADGYSPDVTDPLDPKEVDPLWFASLPSGGPDQALQTLPEPKTGPFGHDQNMGHWYQDSAGKDIQAYKYPEAYAEQAQTLKATGGDIFHLLKGSGTKQANWFDASVSQYDAYGRPKNPYPGNPELLIYQGYQQQAANVSLACADAGCNASATLSLGQADRSELRNCRLSVQVMPTDFGPEKVVEFIKVNDHLVSLNCQPSSNARCDEAASSQFYTCVNGLEVQSLLNTQGSLNISAKISAGVNRSSCAYEGKLLYAVPQLTCLVGKPPDANATGFQNGPQSSPVKLDLRQQKPPVKLALAQEHAERGLRGRRDAQVSEH